VNWYYSDKGQQRGPIDEAEFERLIREGTITPATLVWREGLANWQPLSQARPAQAGPPPAPGTARCAACGNVFPQSDLIQIEGRAICATCKPTVMQQIKEGVTPATGDTGERNGPAWEQRETLGFFKAVFDTVKGVLIEPSQTFARMKREGGMGSPLLYAVAVGSAPAIAGVIYSMMFQLPGILAQQRSHEQAIASLGIGAIIVFAVIFVPVGIVMGAFIGSGITHLCLMMVGGANQPFETTFRVVCYSQGSASVFQLVPVCGGYITGIWNIVASIIGLAKAHETTTGKAAAAVLIPIGVCCGIAVVVIALVGFAAAASLRHH
jgi:hypothetical protein